MRVGGISVGLSVCLSVCLSARPVWMLVVAKVFYPSMHFCHCARRRCNHVDIIQGSLQLVLKEGIAFLCYIFIALTNLIRVLLSRTRIDVCPHTAAGRGCFTHSGLMMAKEWSLCTRIEEGVVEPLPAAAHVARHRIPREILRTLK